MEKTYSAVEASSVDHVFWLAQSFTVWQESTRGAGDGLKGSLGREVILDVLHEISVAQDVLVNNHPKSQG